MDLTKIPLDDLKVSDPLTWDDLADEYDKSHSGRPARTLPMGLVWDWAERQEDIFFIDPVEGTIHKIEK